MPNVSAPLSAEPGLGRAAVVETTAPGEESSLRGRNVASMPIRLKFDSARRKRNRLGSVALGVLYAFQPQVMSAPPSPDIQIVDIAKGGAVDVYFEVNLKGKVFIRIGAAGGLEPCAEFWWVKWPFGNIESLGRRCNSASFEVPGLANLAISAKLRASATNDVKLMITAKEFVANSATFHF